MFTSKKVVARELPTALAGGTEDSNLLLYSSINP
jgi:hypothetical protein